MRWNELPRQTRLEIWRRKNQEMLDGLTPYERDCMFKVHYQQADREPVDEHARQVMEDAVDRFNRSWKQERESQEFLAFTCEQLSIRVSVYQGRNTDEQRDG